MHPLMMAALISGGVNALQGKRGSDLLKSTVRDTANYSAIRRYVTTWWANRHSRYI